MLNDKPKIYSIYLQRARAAYEQPTLRASVEVLLSIFTITGLILIAIRPTFTIVASLQKKIEDKEVVEKKLTTKMTQLLKAQEELNNNVKVLDLFNVVVPWEYNYSGLTKRIEVIANEEGVKIDTLSMPTVSIFGDPIKAGERIKIGATPKEGEVWRTDIALTVVGKFENLKSFAERLERADRLVYFVSIKIKKAETKLTTENKLKMTATANAYYAPSNLVMTTGL